MQSLRVTLRGLFKFPCFKQAAQSVTTTEDRLQDQRRLSD
jgi:hypothetical protein